MLVLAVLALVVFLGIYFFPIAALRGKASGRAQDYFVSCERTPPRVVQNSSIAYALKMATFGPFFALGAGGDFWPAIIAAVAFGLGIGLLNWLRVPFLAFFSGAIGRDRSITTAAFMAAEHGDDPRVRRLAAALTVFALTGLLACEAFGFAVLVQPIVPNVPLFVLMLGLTAVAVLFTLPAGNSGVLRATQAQLGLLYLGLFGSSVLILYIVMATFGRLSPATALSVLVAALICLGVLGYRRSRYVDTSPLDLAAPGAPPDAASEPEPSGARLFRRVNKIINVFVSTLAVVFVVFSGMAIFAIGPSEVLTASAAALQSGTRLPGMGLLALVLLPFFYPLVDVTNWQRLAVLARDAGTDAAAPERWRSSLRIIKIIAVESALMSLFLCLFGALAAAALRLPDEPRVVEIFMQRLSEQQNWIAGGALSLLLVSAVMIALSTMSATLSASFCVLRYDLLGNPEMGPAAGITALPGEAAIRRRAVTIGVALCLVMLAAFAILAASVEIDFSGGGFLALVIAFCCAQLASAPLLLPPLIAGTRRARPGIGPGWALAVLALGAAAGIGAAAIYLATGAEPWLWAAVPACLGIGFLVSIIARLGAGKAA